VKSSSTIGLPTVLVSLGLHAALVTVGLLGSVQEADRQPPASSNDVTTVGASVEVEASAEAPAVTPAPPRVEAGATVAAPEPTLALAAPPRAKAAVRPRAASNALAPSPPRASPAAVPASPDGGPGEARLLPGVKRLGYAFARAIPTAAPGAAAWRDLPLGHVGTIRIELSVDESKRLSQVRPFQEQLGEPAPPPALERLVEQVLLLLSPGHFALSSSNEPGVERLVVDVVLRNDKADEGGADDVVEKRFSGATPALPGKAYFRYGTGRAVEATVTVLSATASHN
jgi:hypothetical protein